MGMITDSNARTGSCPAGQPHWGKLQVAWNLFHNLLSRQAVPGETRMQSRVNHKDAQSPKGPHPAGSSVQRGCGSWVVCAKGLFLMENFPGHKGTSHLFSLQQNPWEVPAAVSWLQPGTLRVILEVGSKEMAGWPPPTPPTQCSQHGSGLRAASL